MDVAKVTYDGVEIAYSEREDNWQFELRGRSRTASSLSKAKEAIDAPPPKDKKAFARIKAYHKTYSGIEEVEITSIAEGSRYGGEVWISKNGDRRKVDQKSMMAFTEKNCARHAAYQDLMNQSESLRKKAQETLNLMTPVDLSGCE